MPCVGRFEGQDAAYHDNLLPGSWHKRVVVETYSSFGCTGLEGDTVSIERRGASTPGPLVMEKCNITVDYVGAKARALG